MSHLDSTGKDIPVRPLSEAEQRLVRHIDEHWNRARALMELRDELQTAVEIELATVPLYLFAYYAINRTPEGFPATDLSRFRLASQRSEQAATLLEWDGDVPVFERVHAELMRARQIIDGDAPTGVDAAGRPQPDSADAVSTPVAFLVPAMMNSSAVCSS